MSLLPKFEEIKDFDDYHQQFMEINGNTREVQKQSLMESTKDIDVGDLKEQMKVRSIKKNVMTPETSFQDSFMHQHFEAFQKITQTYIEKIHPNLKNQNKNFLNNEIFNPQNHKNLPSSIEFLLLSNNGLLNQTKKKQFRNDLFLECKLKEFLNHVVSHCFEDTAEQLIFIAHEIWQAYIEVQSRILNYEELIQMFSKLVDQTAMILYSSNQMRSLNFKNDGLVSQCSEDTIKKHFKQFLKGYCVTIILVIAEFFINPYFEYNDGIAPKRDWFSYNELADDFSDDEESSFMVTCKKRKS